MSTENSETRTKILTAALKLLEENRGKNVRMSDIAKAAGVSRQAVYLHFESRNNLMVATVQYGDELRQTQQQAQPWQDAQGVEKLDAWIAFWGNYFPQIYGVAKALFLARETDEAAAAAWNDRMTIVQNSCRETIESLAENDLLAPEWDVKTATDMAWTLMSFPAWEQFIYSCGWSTKQYIKRMQTVAHHTLLKTGSTEKMSAQ